MINYAFPLLFFLASTCASNTSSSPYTELKKETDNSHQKEYDSGDVVFDIYLAKDGKLWIATSQEGVFCYDGNSFQNFTMENGLCGNEISSILEDTEGNFWFGTENGLCKFDGKNYTNIPLPDYPKSSDWLDKYYPMMSPEKVTELLEDDNGNIWAGSSIAGLYKFDGERFEAFLQEEGNLMPDSMHHNSISALAKDKNGHVWIGSFSHGGINQYNDEEFMHHALPDGYGDGMISSIFIDNEEKIWAGTRNGGIYSFNGTEFKSFSPQVKEIPMAKFFQDGSGALWMSSYARGRVYQLKEGKFEFFQADQSEQLLDIMCMAEDKDGNIWFGGRYGLLWKYDGKALEDYTLSK